MHRSAMRWKVSVDQTLSIDTSWPSCSPRISCVGEARVSIAEMHDIELQGRRTCREIPDHCVVWPERLAMLRQHLQAGFRQLGAAQEHTLEAQQGFGNGPALIELANEIVGRNVDVIERTLRRILRARQYRLIGPHGDAGCLDVDQQEADAFLFLGRGVGAYQHKHVRGVLGQCGPDLSDR